MNLISILRSLNVYLTLSHGGNLILDGQHQFGLSGQILAAPLFVLQGYGDAARQVVHAADDGGVSISLYRPHDKKATLLKLCHFDRNMLVICLQLSDQYQYYTAFKTQISSHSCQTLPVC